KSGDRYEIKYNLDSAGNAAALQLLDVTRTKDAFVVIVAGEEDGSTLRVQSLVEGDSAALDETPSCEASTVEGYECTEQLTDGISLNWNLRDAAAATRRRGLRQSDQTVELYVEVEASLNAAYVSLGFGTQMAGSDVVVGYTDSNGASTTGTYTLGSYVAPSEGSCTDCSFAVRSFTTQSTGSSALVFTAAVPASEDEETSFVWSYGTSDWPVKHTKAGAVRINLASGVSSGIASPLKDEHTAHGALMITAWLVITPASAMVARSLRHIIGAPAWFNVHIGLNSVAGVLFLAGILLAFDKFDSGNLPQSHKEVGAAVLWMWMVQVVLGALRPDAHGKLRLGCIQPSWRPAWLAAHRVVAAACLICGATNCITGAMRYEDLHDEKSMLVASLSMLGIMVIVATGMEVMGLPAKAHADAVAKRAPSQELARNTSNASSISAH
ncbi:hypothetical protein CYMTET_26854, partial [Cymbomonas tetramitiformis]